MKNRINRWERLCARLKRVQLRWPRRFRVGALCTRLKQLRLHWPRRFWLAASIGWLVLTMDMAVRTMKHGVGNPVPGVIRAAPLVMHRVEGSTDSPGGGSEALRNRVAARRSLAAVRNWEQWMDSLRQTVGGAAIYDSILLARPGLLDTAKEVEEYYLKQLK